MKKSYLLVLLMLIFVLGACGGGNTNKVDSENSGATDRTAEKSDGESNEQIELNLSHVLAENSSFHATAVKLAELVEERTDGDITIEIFPAGQLGGEVQSIQAARNGNQDLIVTGTPALTGTAPEFLALDLPYLFNDLDDANDFLQGPVGDDLLDGLKEYGLIGLGFTSSLERNVFANKAVQSLDDFENLNIRVVESDGYIDAYKALGAQPTPMAYSEVYLSLQQGVIDAGEAAADTMITDKFMEVATHYNLTKSHFYPVVLIISEKSWNLLSEEQQEIMAEAAKEATQEGINVFAEDYEASLKTMEESGIEIVETDMASFKEATQSLRDDFIENNPDLNNDLVDLIKN